MATTETTDTPTTTTTTSTTITTTSTTTTQPDIERRVLLAVDDSVHSQRAFHWYLDQIHKETDLLIMFHVFDPPTTPAYGVASVALVTEYNNMLQHRVAESKMLAQKYREECRAKHLHNFNFLHVLGGDTGEEIVKAAKEYNASMIVLGTRGLGTFKRIFLGSVSEHVLHHAHVPCLICPPGKDGDEDYPNPTLETAKNEVPVAMEKDKVVE